MTGYPDWAREESIFGEEAIDDDNVAYISSKSFARIDCLRYEGAHLRFIPIAEAQQILFDWFTAETGGSRLASAMFQVRQDDELMLPLVHRGPWLSVNLSTLGAANCEYTLHLQQTRALREIPAGGEDEVLALINQSIGAGVTDTTDFLYPYTGPALFHVTTTAPSWACALRYQDSAGVEQNVARFNNADGQNPSIIVHIPPMRCRLITANSGAGAATFRVTVVPLYY